MKKVILEIDCELASMSKVIIDGKEVINVTGLDIVATVKEPIPKVIFTLSGSEINTDPLDSTKFFVQPHCPKCGFDGEKYAIGVGEDNSDKSDKFTGIS